MSTKLDAAGLATEYVKRVDPEKRLSLATSAALLFSYADAIREHSQPLADELATVKAELDKLLAQLQMLVRMSSDGRSSEARLKAERDELREALEKIEDHFDMDGYDADAWKNLALEMASAARSILDKYPKP